MKKITIIIVICAIIFILLVVLLFIAAFGGFNFLLSVPDPQIKYGEFPCKLTYEINGEIKTVEDTIICEFDGYEVLGESGKYRKWKSHLKSGNEEIVLLDLRNRNEKNEFGHTMLELFFYWGSAEFYMGDYESGRAREAQDFNWIEYKYKTDENQIGGSGYKADEAFEKYAIKLIKWEIAEPIENSFD